MKTAALNPAILAVVSLRAAALAAVAAGQGKYAEYLLAAADFIDSGRATDAHMSEVAEKLKARDLTPADWLDAAERIKADSARLQSA